MRIKPHTNTYLDHDRARKLRREATPYEQKLWLALRGEAKKHDLKFRRQHPLHPFIVDFICLKARLVIEIDGYSHDVRYDYDTARDAEISAMGYTILRFTNEDVTKNLPGIIAMIIERAISLVDKLPPVPPSVRGEGVLNGKGMS